MRLINQMLKKKLELSDEKLLAKEYKRYMWEYYIAYNLARALIKFNDLEVRAKNKAYKKLVLSSGKTDTKYFKKMDKFIRKDLTIIIKALNLIQKSKEEAGFEFGEYYKPGTLTILSADYPEEC